MPDSLSPVFLGIGGFLTGGGVTNTFRNAQAVTQGQTDYVAYRQSRNLTHVVSGIFYALDEAGKYQTTKTGRRWAARLICYPLAFSLQILNHHIDGKSSPRLKSSILFARNHLNHLTFGLDLCVTAIFSLYVTPLYGIGMLAGLSLELLSEYNKLPVGVKKAYEKFSLLLCFTGVFGLGIYSEIDLLDAIHICLMIAIFAYETYRTHSLPPDFFNHHLTEENAKKLLETPIENFQFNWSQITQDTHFVTPGAAKLDIEKTMKEHGKKVEWTDKNLTVFKESLWQNQSFRAYHPQYKEKQDLSDKETKKFFSTGLERFAHSVATEIFEKGNEYIRYNILQGMLRSVLFCTKELKGIELADLLSTFALEGFEVCADGQIKVIENAYNTYESKAKKPLSS